MHLLFYAFLIKKNKQKIQYLNKKNLKKINTSCNLQIKNHQIKIKSIIILKKLTHFTHLILINSFICTHSSYTFIDHVISYTAVTRKMQGRQLFLFYFLSI